VDSALVKGPEVIKDVIKEVVPQIGVAPAPGKAASGTLKNKKQTNKQNN
jgi:hypothetical protein